MRQFLEFVIELRDDFIVAQFVICRIHKADILNCMDRHPSAFLEVLAGLDNPVAVINAIMISVVTIVCPQ